MSQVRIPADVDREDRILAGLTGRQLLILAPVAIGLWAAYAATRHFLPLPVFAGLVFPLAVVALSLALGRRDGLPADRLALAAFKQTRAPRRLVPERGDSRSSLAGVAGKSEAPTAPLEPPARSIDQEGILDLGREGFALVCSASSINFALRSHAEQAALVSAFGRFLNSVNAPMQIVVRAERADLTKAVSDLRTAAAKMPHRALEAAALEHADYLESLAAKREVLRRQVLVVLREPRITGESGGTLRRRADDARSALRAAGITLTPLSAAEAYQALARAVDPELAGTGAVSAPIDQIVT